MLQVSDPIPQFTSPEELALYLRIEGCKRCDLGYQPELHGCCIARGTTKNQLMIIGEGPGKDEDRLGSPFTGLAGQLLDKIWNSIGMSTQNWWLTNCVLCRPIAPKGSGRQNLTPKTEQLNRCRPFLIQQIHLLEPKLIVTLGNIATTALLGKCKIGDIHGQLVEKDIEGYVTKVFPMIHPAAILHSEGDIEKWNEYRSQTWSDVKQLRSLVDGIDTRK